MFSLYPQYCANERIYFNAYNAAADLLKERVVNISSSAGLDHWSIWSLFQSGQPDVLGTVYLHDTVALLRCFQTILSITD